MTDENQVKAEKARGIETVVNAMNAHINNPSVCFRGCTVFWNLAYANTFFQKEVCEKGGLNTLLRVLWYHLDSKSLLGPCCSAIGVILSSHETHSKFCTPEVIRAVEECYEKHKDSEVIRQFLLGLKREEDPRVCSSVERSVCTKEGFPKCSEGCRCDKNVYCPKCFVQQKTFRCFTCEIGQIKMCCEVCWKRDHQGHHGKEFFFPVGCTI